MTNRWAFLVGVNNYTDPTIANLRFCVNDVVALEKTLAQLGYEVLCLHDELDRNHRLFPTRDNVEARLIELCRAVQPDDLIWVHFACHGTRVKREGNKKEPVLITQDTQLALLKQRALSVAEVEQHMRNSKARKLVLTLDACESGVDIGRSLIDREFIHNVYELAEGFALIAASTAEQTAGESLQNKHGIFTYYLLEGLSGKADRSGKNLVTVDDLKTHVLDGLRRWNVKNGGLQEPTARTEGLGDIILADYREAQRKNVGVNPPATLLENQPVAKMSRAKKLRIESIEKEIHKLEKDYQDVNDKKLFTSNPQEINNLELQLNHIASQIDEKERELEGLNQGNE